MELWSIPVGYQLHACLGRTDVRSGMSRAKLTCPNTCLAAVRSDQLTVGHRALDPERDIETSI